MQKPAHKNTKILLSTEEEVFNAIVGEDHAFRKLNNLIPFDSLVAPLRETFSPLGETGYDVMKGFKAMLVQHWEDYSDREMEKCLQENMAVRWFCGFGLTERTPDHSYFGRLRDRLGAKRIADIFNNVNDVLRAQGLYGDTFQFIDASSLITKTALWKERDKAIADGEEKLNNSVVSKYAADKNAKWGAKGNMFWFGYKRHHAVDMRYWLVSKVALTAANVHDVSILNQLCPRNMMVFMDKLYDTKQAELILKMHGSASGTVRKKTNPEKNRDLDIWRSKTRMPFEGNFSKMRKKTRYRGYVKVLGQCFMEAMVYNLKKTVKLVPMNR